MQTTTIDQPPELFLGRLGFRQTAAQDRQSVIARSRSLSSSVTPGCARTRATGGIGWKLRPFPPLRSPRRSPTRRQRSIALLRLWPMSAHG
ncbi:hypothetical protein CN151_03905 [Sinorhizobium meliloti]|nr:hypothetical protein C5N13_10855 [Sinorhizobium meliloti]RVG74734.1 hypothetical protein CN219_32975 [Sinorhizobium meliloti]RVI21184.1 hypothetical protein CN197_34355 [Sinorhizobium meliloti]RVI39838.1 hypothetical protein CN196_30485 [Sinorhizobium meliloti]RVI88906.1 hypothetical protein CN190_10080 [Sinorhizobium meliloti]